MGDDQNGNNVAPNQNQPVNAQDEALENAKQGATNEINQKLLIKIKQLITQQKPLKKKNN